MLTGILLGLTAAICNSVGYIFSARFLVHYRSPVRLLAVASVLMMVFGVPLLAAFPFGRLLHPGAFALNLFFWVLAFYGGQGAFFMSFRYFEASRLSSLLGLKIIVLAVLFMTFQGGRLSFWQWCAVFLAAGSAMLFNWSGKGKTDPRGWLFLLATLIGYSCCDINETKIVLAIQETGAGLIRSSLASAGITYTVLGVVTLPALLYFRPTVRQLRCAFPYAFLWIASQIAMFGCFALLLPVFGNVILASRGIFSVAIGAALPALGLARFDSRVSRNIWIRRGIAAAAMSAAIALYSIARAGYLG